VNALFDTYALAKMMPVEAGVRVPPVIDTVIDTPREHDSWLTNLTSNAEQ